MEKRSLNPALHWEEIREICQRIFLKEIPFRDPMEITKGWNPNRNFKLLKEREGRISENQDPIQAIEEQLIQEDHTLIAEGSQEVNQPDSPVASHH
ncbi:hypothetical protein O181_108695 [Austropuccinia psidii MF-1]|uniref:Uncharacterized protein n=1 Tax=Austropuccinia psidii MF-1 TaxID=1389203 RepID=A0A9Q3JSW7_9BASI|nr:hypothetical protein [Austropuccinia psidii MF-1]